MKFLIDMNLSPRWAQALAAGGFEAAHWSTKGAFNATDATIMQFAAQHGYVVLTHDLDFGAILAATQGEKPSVVQIRAESVDPDLIASRVNLALTQVQVDLEEGALLTIDEKRTRLRILPLKLR